MGLWWHSSHHGQINRDLPGFIRYARMRVRAFCQCHYVNKANSVFYLYSISANIIPLLFSPIKLRISSVCPGWDRRWAQILSGVCQIAFIPLNGKRFGREPDFHSFTQNLHMFRCHFFRFVWCSLKCVCLSTAHVSLHQKCYNCHGFILIKIVFFKLFNLTMMS